MKKALIYLVLGASCLGLTGCGTLGTGDDYCEPTFKANQRSYSGNPNITFGAGVMANDPNISAQDRQFFRDATISNGALCIPQR